MSTDEQAMRRSEQRYESYLNALWPCATARLLGVS